MLLWNLTDLFFRTDCYESLNINGYEFLNGNLRLIILTRGSK
jgi:hypothetical protein